MNIKSHNMHYAYNKEYFDQILLNQDEKSVANANRKIFDYVYPQDTTIINSDICTYSNCEFELYTIYPGLFLGLGYPHASGVKNSIAGGFSLDQITGLPMIPGSTIKGILKAAMRDEYTGDSSALKEKSKEKNAERKALVCSLLNREMTDKQYDTFIKRVFEGTDVFLDAYPMINKGNKIFAGEYVTSHKEVLKDPNPVQMLKVKPGIRYKFMFKLENYHSTEGDISISVEEKRQLFKELILLFGIGAKTNVGFGQFSEKAPIPTNRTKPIPKMSEKKQCETQQSATKSVERRGDPPMCKNPGCENKVRWDESKNRWFYYCQSCFLKKVKKNK